MGDQSFYLQLVILCSNHKYYKNDKFTKIHILKKIGEGSYGIIFLLDNNHVIKIYKKSNYNNENIYSNKFYKESSELIPLENENRELGFFIKYLNDNDKQVNNNFKNFIIDIYAIGIIKDKIIYNNTIININNYFIILPLCYPLYNIYKIYNIPLIDTIYGFDITIKIMKRFLEISHYLENNLNIYNIDLRINNFMINNTMYSNNLIKNKLINIELLNIYKLNNNENNILLLNYIDNTIKNLIISDFSIIKKNNKKKYNIINKYYIWPIAKNILLENLPSYSICINSLELLFGYDNIKNFPNNKIDKYLKIIKNKNKKLYDIFLQGLQLKLNTEIFIKLLHNL